MQCRGESFHLTIVRCFCYLKCSWNSGPDTGCNQKLTSLLSLWGGAFGVDQRITDRQSILLSKSIGGGGLSDYIRGLQTDIILSLWGEAFRVIQRITHSMSSFYLGEGFQSRSEDCRQSSFSLEGGFRSRSEDCGQSSFSLGEGFQSNSGDYRQTVFILSKRVFQCNSGDCSLLSLWGILSE